MSVANLTDESMESSTVEFAKLTIRTSAEEGPGNLITDGQAPHPLLDIPPSGSTDPSVSLTALWALLQPAFDHMLLASTDNPGETPPISFIYYGSAHAAVHKYISYANDSSKAQEALYKRVDQYYGEIAVNIFINTPSDSMEMLDYLSSSFLRFSNGAKIIQRIMATLGRTYVRTEYLMGHGWYGSWCRKLLRPVVWRDLSTGATGVQNKLSQKQVLEKWGYRGDGSDYAEFEAYVEAASPPGRIVPLTTLAYRHFRRHIIRPLLTTTTAEEEERRQAEAGGTSGTSSATGAAFISGNGASTTERKEKTHRLGRAISNLLEENCAGANPLARKLADMLQKCGLRPNHPIVKELNRFIRSHDLTS